MTEPDDAVLATVKPKKGISWAWFLPAIAFVIGLFLFYDAWTNRGTDIIVQFRDAEGIEAQRTLVKYRNVEIGRVERIRFADDGQSILCYINVYPGMDRFLKIDSQFWVVRPRIGRQGISGINTLLSGAYITLQPGEEDTLTDAFVGLSAPPIASPNEGGLKLTLVSDGGKSLNEGNPVLYRGTEVGIVEAAEFNVEERNIHYEIFIRAPYDQLVTTNTFFWNASGVSVNTGVDGINVDLASIEALISGGVSFDVPDDLEAGEPITTSQDFTLYPDRIATYEAREYEYLEYAILVDDTVGGLIAGAPVEYRGIKIGRVAKPYLGFDETFRINSNEERIPVIIHIEPKRLSRSQNYDTAWFTNQFEVWIKTGLEARLETANYITGSLKVSLDQSGDGTDIIQTFGEYKVIPLATGSFAGLLNKTDELLTKLNELPLEALLNNTNATVDTAKETMSTATDALVSITSLVESAEKTLLEANRTLKTLQPDSVVHERLVQNLDELQATLQMLQPVISDIQQKPNSLVFSSPPPEDKAPRKKQ